MSPIRTSWSLAASIAVALALGVGTAARAQGPLTGFRDGVSNWVSGYDPTTHTPDQFGQNVVKTPVVVVGMMAVGGLDVMAAGSNILRGRDPNAPPPQTYSTPSSGQGGVGQRLGTTAPGRPSNRPGSGMEGQRLGRTAPGRPWSPKFRQPYRFVAYPQLLGDIRARQWLRQQSQQRPRLLGDIRAAQRGQPIKVRQPVTLRTGTVRSYVRPARQPWGTSGHGQLAQRPTQRRR